MPSHSTSHFTPGHRVQDIDPVPYNWAGFHQVNSMLQPGRWISSATQATARKGSIAVRKEAGTTDPCPASWSSRKRKSSSVRRHGRRSSRPASLGAGPSCWWGRTWPVA
uniref:Uncharacterized protein n=1 Tax=Aegilops tauschii subsp. strangulata TaxID=200361 RepID=A0A453L5L2_AEGTS